MKNSIKAYSVALLTLSVQLTYAQWIPNPRMERLSYFQHEPLCNDKRQQVRARLLDTAKFLFREDVPSGTVLYAVRFKSVGARTEGATGVAFCEPYQAKKLTFWSGHRANQINDEGIANGFNLYGLIPRPLGRYSDV